MQEAINSKSEAVERIVTTFAERYGGSPSLFRAPGRVNLIGEHIITLLVQIMRGVDGFLREVVS